MAGRVTLLWLLDGQGRSTLLQPNNIRTLCVLWLCAYVDVYICNHHILVNRFQNYNSFYNIFL